MKTEGDERDMEEEGKDRGDELKRLFFWNFLELLFYFYYVKFYIN
jgi:hypothetical protein